MIFRVLAERNANDQRVFLYDNITNTLQTEDNYVFEYPNQNNTNNGLRKEYKPFDVQNPLKKSKKVKILKIQLGLSCNYSCEYCSQRFVERPKETSQKDIETFIKTLEFLEFSEKDGLKIEYWGGEPFVYWKTMRPLHEELKKKFAGWVNKPAYSIITNGSILNEEICDWLVTNNFSVAVSHDGPGQHVRGPDPFEDPKNKEMVLSLYKRLRPQSRMSFNSMLNTHNRSRKEIFDWFVEFTGDPTVPLGEGAIVDAYDEGGLVNSLATKQDHFDFRRKSFADIHSTGGNIGFGGILQKIDDTTNMILAHSHAKYLGQKCGMDKEDVIAIDLRGNVITCQNVSAVDINSNGESHLGGNISDIEAVEIKTSTHWSQRDHCSECPVLSVCQGACMFVTGKLWHQTCANSYSNAVPLWALSFHAITGYIPIMIESEHLPDERKDIWGTMLEHKEEEKPRKTIPIKVVSSPQKTIINDIEVYTKS
jgi:uncharacterized protein